MRGGRWLRSRVQKFLDYWTPRLGLTPWTIRVLWSPARGHVRHIFAHANAYTHRQARRMSAEIVFNERTLARDAGNDFEVEAIVVHELVHVLLGGNEQVVNTVALALVRERRERNAL